MDPRLPMSHNMYGLICLHVDAKMTCKDCPYYDYTKCSCILINLLPDGMSKVEILVKLNSNVFKGLGEIHCEIELVEECLIIMGMRQILCSISIQISKVQDKWVTVYIEKVMV